MSFRKRRDSTTDEDQDENSPSEAVIRRKKYVSIKLPGESWEDKSSARQLKSWLRSHVSLRERSYAANYVSKFIEVAQIASKFTNQQDQDRAFDEVMSVFVEWPKTILVREIPEFSNQNLLQILTELGIPYWFPRILWALAIEDHSFPNSKEFQASRKALLEHQDNLGNTFSHYLMKYISRDFNSGIWTTQLALNDPLWFGTIRKEFLSSFDSKKNKIQLTPFELLNDPLLRLHLTKEFESAKTATTQKTSTSPFVLGTPRQISQESEKAGFALKKAQGID